MKKKTKKNDDYDGVFDFVWRFAKNSRQSSLGLIHQKIYAVLSENIELRSF